jgi:hypothetical protein
MTGLTTPQKIYFKMKAVVEGLYIEETIIFKVNDFEDMQFVVHSTGSDESRNDSGFSTLDVFTVEVRFSKTGGMIETLSDIVKSGNVQMNENGVISSDFLPNEVKGFIIELATNCISSMRRFCKFLSWKSGCIIPLTFKLKERLHFSFDEKVWHMQPLNRTLYPSEIIERLLPKNLSNFSQIKYTHDSSEYIEPFYHELIRSAITQFDTDLRSSLVMGWIALESGTKDLIAYFIPESAWLIENTPSPNIHKILKDFLPSMILSKLDRDQFKLPSECLKRIQRHMEIRNSLVHGRNITVNREELNIFLLQVRSILYLIDYLKGSNWARDLIIEELQPDNNSIQK